MSCQVGLGDHPMVKEDNPKVKGRAKIIGGRLQKSTLTRKVILKAPTSGLEENLFNFKKNVVEFVKNCEAISKFIAVKYKHRGVKISMAIKKMEIL